MREIDVYINLLLENGYILKEKEYSLFNTEKCVSEYINEHNCTFILYCDPVTHKIQYHISFKYSGGVIDGKWHLTDDLDMKLREYKIDQILK